MFYAAVLISLNMIHIVFNEADTKVLKDAIDLDETLQGRVLCIQDDYAVGPIHDLYKEEGIEERKSWWKGVCDGNEFEPGAVENTRGDYDLMVELRSTLKENPEELIWIWAAQNNHDVCGYFWLLHFVKEFQGRVFILYLNNLPFFNDKGNIFYPARLHTIPPKEFIKAKKLARPITPSEFEIDPDEWSRLIQERKGVRLLEGGKKLKQFDEDYYDADVRKFITRDWQKAGRVINQFLSKNKDITGSAFLLWRLRVMVSTGEMEAQGELKNMKDFEIKIKANVPEQVNQ